MHRHRCVAHSRDMNWMMLNRSNLAVHLEVCLADYRAAWRVLVLDDVSRTSLKR